MLYQNVFSKLISFKQTPFVNGRFIREEWSLVPGILEITNNLHMKEIFLVVVIEKPLIW